MMHFMRTTPTIDDERPRPVRAAFRVEPFASEFQPGVDPGRLNRLLDEMETQDFLAKRDKSGPTR